MGIKRIFLALLSFTFMDLQAQLLAPRPASKINLMVEAGAAFEMMADNATHGLIHGTATVKLDKFLILRGSLYQGTKSRFNNLKSKVSNNMLLEAHFSPAFKMWGFYAAYDLGQRNYKFENLEQFDAETGASNAQPHPVLYTSDITTPNAVMQYTLPNYRFGMGWYIQAVDGAKDKNNQTTFQASFFGSYAPAAKQFGTSTSDASLFNIDVPTRYSGNSVLQARKLGYGALFYLQTPQNIGGRMELGMRPTLYDGTKAEGVSTGFYFHFGLSLRLI